MHFMRLVFVPEPWQDELPSRYRTRSTPLSPRNWWSWPRMHRLCRSFGQARLLGPFAIRFGPWPSQGWFGTPNLVFPRARAGPFWRVGRQTRNWTFSPSHRRPSWPRIFDHEAEARQQCPVSCIGRIDDPYRPDGRNPGLCDPVRFCKLLSGFKQLTYCEICIN